MITSTGHLKETAESLKTASRLPSLITVLLLACMFVLAGGAALRESVTFDEVAHIGAGLSYWQKLDLRLNEEHPPLAKLLAALPLALQRTRADYSHPSWTFSSGFFPAYMGQWVFGEYLLTRWNNPRHVLAWARLPMLLLTVVLGWVIFAVGRRIAGPWSGLLAVSAYATAPVFLTFGPLVLTDLAITLFSLLSLWTFAELWTEPSRKKTALFALSFAGALLSKFSSGMLLFAFIGAALSLRWWPLSSEPETILDRKNWRQIRRRATVKGIFWAAILVYVVYFVFSWNQPPQLFHGTLAATLGRLLMPPWLYLRGLLMVAITGNRPAYLLGHTHPHGVWYYFPVLLLLKSTLGFLGLLATGGALMIHVKRSRRDTHSIIPADVRTHWRILWVACIIFAGLSIISYLNVCYRHFSVPLVLMTLLLAPIPSMIQHLRLNSPRLANAAAVLTVLLAVSSLFTALRQYPYYMPYINALAFGRPAYTLMSDANLDWNQALPDVNRFAREHNVARLKIDEYGFTDSATTVPGSELWDCQAPATEDAGQWVVVSADVIMDTHNCTWLMQYPHEELGGGSMYAVHLPQPIPAAGLPGGPPPPSDRRMFVPVGNRDLRLLFQGVIRNPESLSHVVQDMTEEFKKAAAEQKKAKSGK